LNKEIIKPIKPEECDNLAKSNLAGFNKFKWGFNILSNKWSGIKIYKKSMYSKKVS
jgi:hypothetical protein